MKKNIIYIMLALIIIIVVVIINISNVKIKQNAVVKFNSEFEKYKEKTLYGADILTIINKAIDNNKEYKVARDENGNYIPNDENSLKIELILLTKDEKGEEKEVTYPMETLEKAGLDEFISSFSLTEFKITNIEENSIHRISKITVKQLEM